MISCGAPIHHVHLDASGNCIDEPTGRVVDQRVCYGYSGGYYGGVHYVYVPGNSAPYYRSPDSPGYVKGSGSATSSGTTFGVFGESAGHAASGEAGE